MRSFQVLDRNENVHKNHLLEASAGTGKTFSIENVVARLLLEKDVCTLDQILIVTFTRAATRDLRKRVHDNLLKTIQLLKDSLEGFQNRSSMYADYVQRIIEAGDEETSSAIRKLERAVCCFDDAQIYTIHSFCLQMLTENVFEGNFSMQDIESVESFGYQGYRKIIKDFIRAGIEEASYSGAQLRAVIGSFQGEIEKLENALLNTISKGVAVEKVSDYPELLSNFNQTMHVLKEKYRLTGQFILEEFLRFAPYYKGISRKINPDILERVVVFSELFDKTVWVKEDLEWLIDDGLFILDLLQPRLLTEKGKTEPVNTPAMVQVFREHLLEYVSPNPIFARMAYDCKRMLDISRERDEVFGFDDFLSGMEKALVNERFLAQVRARYRAAVIDEFQDTDPVQWRIFQELFMGTEEAPILYLVGDPKQSIYAFRQADIYTYLQAARRIGEANHASLDTNYRSQPSLVRALNVLFKEESCPELFYLPKEHRSMAYPEVHPSPTAQERQFSDDKGAIHFFIAEDPESKRYPLEQLEQNCFFPFMVREVIQLVENDGFCFRQIAVLVADRYQGARIHDFFKKWNIPSTTQRATSIVDTPAFSSTRELLEAVLNSKDLSALKIALGGKILRWDHEGVKSLDDPQQLEWVLRQFLSLREGWMQNGFATFYQSLLASVWTNEGLTVQERFLAEEGGEEFFQDFLQVIDLLLEFEAVNRRSPDSLIKFLDELRFSGDDNEEKTQRYRDPAKNAVKIMTLHASKGLEFEVVFALGLVKRSKPTERLISTVSDGKPVLSPVVDPCQPHYQAYCRETDAEKMRQLYVAMTRAKYRLYNPVVYAPRANSIELASASPMDLFLARLGQEPASPESLYKRIEGYDAGILRDFIQSLPDDIEISCSSLNNQIFSLERYQPRERFALRAPPSFPVKVTKRYINSFTTLASPKGTSQELILDQLEPPRKFENDIKTPHTLPAGSETGSLLHLCLENVSFESVKALNNPSGIAPMIYPYIKGTPYESWNGTLCDIAYRALKTSLGMGFSLSDVSSERCFKEGEFLYPSRNPSPPGYIKGFIDLFFEFEGKYYLLDWKSNWLGPDQSHYTRDSMEKAMKEHDYFLQAAFYKEALRKYIRLVDKRPFRDLFGGIFYIFLRGLSDEGTGVYHFMSEESV